MANERTKAAAAATYQLPFQLGAAVRLARTTPGFYDGAALTVVGFHWTPLQSMANGGAWWIEAHAADGCNYKAADNHFVAA